MTTENPTPQIVMPSDAADLEKRLAQRGYLAEPRVALVAWLALKLGRGSRERLIDGPQITLLRF